MTTATELKRKIKKKFGNQSRFSVLSEIPFHTIQNAFKTGHEMNLRKIEKAIEATENRAIYNEVSKDLIDKVKTALKPKDKSIWCRDNGVQHYWLDLFLKGKVRFINHRVTRLLSLLEIDLEAGK